MSRIYWWDGDRASAEQAGREAIEVLEQAGDDRLLALALSNHSQLFMLARRPAESIAFGERAAALARQAGDAATLSHALTNIGTSQWYLGSPAGELTLAEALRVALDAGDVEDACRAYGNRVWNLLDWFRLDEAERSLQESIKLGEEAEFLGFLSYFYMERARLEFARGRWDETVRLAEQGLDAAMPTKCTALTLLGRVRARRGEPGAASLLGSAWDLAVRVDEMQRKGPVAAGRAEDAWLRGDHAALRDLVTPVHAEAVQLGDLLHQAELSYWLAKAAHQPGGPGGGQHHPAPGDDNLPAGGQHPYALLVSGRWQEAAAAWAAAGCRYEHAAALAESQEPRHLLTALEILDDLGARPLATQVRSRLRALGVTSIPRGPLGETRANPAGLTARQVAVLRLLSQGYTNAQIASQLVVSVRTVDSHVAAVLGKLGAADRRDAAARAADLGVLDVE
jgi:ATP/maltotriose-dependent transcriptional regulator MalT